MIGNGELLDGRYQLIRHVGSGATGEVWMAQHLVLKKIVAVKILASKWTGDVETVQRFRREAQTVAELKPHPNLVSVIDGGAVVDEFGEQLYIAMDYVDGSNLAELIRLGLTGDFRWKIEVLAGIAEALECAHQINIIHRDVKPANILVSSNDHVAKLTDFGIALSARHEGNRLTSEDMSVGTEEFVSPEQVVQGGAVTAGSDVYSLAVVGYNLFSRELPFRGLTRRETAIMRIRVEPTPLPDYVPADVRALLMGILSVREPRRVNSAAQFARELRACRLGELPIPDRVASEIDTEDLDGTKKIASEGVERGNTSVIGHLPPSVRQVSQDLWHDLAPHERVLKIGQQLHDGNIAVIAGLSLLSLLLGVVTGIAGFVLLAMLLAL